MPFDSLPVHTTVESSLAAIGFRSVPRELAEAHKAKMVAAFAKQCPEYAARLADGRAAWQTYDMTKGLATVGSDGWTYLRLLQVITSIEDGTDRTKTTIPPGIVPLIDEVAAGIQNASFEVEYFDKDPILNVRYHDSAGQHHDCLAIWDGQTLIAIASRR